MRSPTATIWVLGPGSSGNHPSIAAVRAACSHLRVTAYEDAYLALLIAESLLPRFEAEAGGAATP